MNTAQNSETIKASTGYLSVRVGVDGRRLWTVMRHNSPISVPTDLRTALRIARRVFGRVTISVWDVDAVAFDSEFVCDPNY